MISKGTRYIHVHPSSLVVANKSENKESEVRKSRTQENRGNRGIECLETRTTGRRD